MPSALEELFDYEETAGSGPVLWAIGSRTASSATRRVMSSVEPSASWPIGIYVRVAPAAAVEDYAPRLSALERLRQRASRVTRPMRSPQLPDADPETSPVESIIVVGTDQLPEITEEWEQALLRSYEAIGGQLSRGDIYWLPHPWLQDELFIARSTSPPTTNQKQMQNARQLPDAFQGQEWMFLPGKLRPCLIASSDRECRQQLFKRVLILPIMSYNNPDLRSEIEAGLRPHNYPIPASSNFGLHEGYVDLASPLGFPKVLLDHPVTRPICRMNEEHRLDFIDRYAEWFLGDDK